MLQFLTVAFLLEQGHALPMTQLSLEPLFLLPEATPKPREAQFSSFDHLPLAPQLGLLLGDELLLAGQVSLQGGDDLSLGISKFAWSMARLRGCSSF